MKMIYWSSINENGQIKEKQMQWIKRQNNNV